MNVMGDWAQDIITPQGFNHGEDWVWVHDQGPQGSS
jgi:hypothetical protein